MAHEEETRKALGKRLSAARNLKDYTIDSAAKRLTELGYPLTKQALGHWETGRNVPDAIWLSRLAKLYNTTLDALVWDESISIEAIQWAAEYDGLNEQQRKQFAVVWLAFTSQVVDDKAVEEKMPVTKKSKERV